MSDLTVHQPTYCCYSLGVTAAMVPICLPQTLVAPHAQDGVLHHYVAPEGVALLLARVPLVCLCSALWTLGALLECVYHHAKLGYLFEQVVQRATVLSAWVRHSHVVLTRLGKQHNPSAHQPRYGRV